MYIDLEKARREFLNYAKTFDTSISHIDRKIWHSLRVMDASNKIAKMQNLNEENIEIATLIGLLHDIARFEQFTQFQTFSDLNSFDHGDYGAKLLFEDGMIKNYIDTDKYNNIIEKAIKNHNKFAIEEGLTQREEFFAKLIRDADKLDIIYESTYIFWKGEEDKILSSKIDEDVLEQFLNKKQIKREKGKKYLYINNIISVIAFIYDINYKETFELIHKNNYINRILDRYKFDNANTKEEIEKVRKIANDYINEKINIK